MRRFADPTVLFAHALAFILTSTAFTSTRAAEAAGESEGTVPGKDFADALWAAWIGSEPATKSLRAGLLGR